MEAGKSNAKATIRSTGPAPFAVGQTISGPGIPYGTTIKAVAAGSLTLSAAATSTHAGASLISSSQCTETEGACTIDVSEAAERESGTQGSHYWTASADGSIAIFLTGPICMKRRSKKTPKAGCSYTRI